MKTEKRFLNYLATAVFAAPALLFGGIDNVPGDYDVLARDLAVETSSRAAAVSTEATIRQAADAEKLNRDGGNLLPSAVIVSDTGYSYTPGIYTRISETSYQKTSNVEIRKYSGYWAMVTLFDDEELERYRVDSDADYPPKDGWYAVNGSAEPLPALSYVADSAMLDVLGIGATAELDNNDAVSLRLVGRLWLYYADEGNQAYIEWDAENMQLIITVVENGETRTYYDFNN